MKVLYLPLDERPCNYVFPTTLPTNNLELIIPPYEILGLKKTKANIDKLQEFVLDNIKNVDYVIASLDLLIYGGLIPSRLHHSSQSELIKKADFIFTLKNINPKVKIYSFLSIMRCPFYSISSEEPDYYKDFGKEIHNYGKLTHKKKLNIISDDELIELNRLESFIPSEVINDFTSRRKTNLSVLKHVLDNYSYFDYFFIPQDDSAPYGFTSIDQEEIKKYVKENNSTINSYPSADEIGMVLLSRVINDYYHLNPKVYVLYCSPLGKDVIPNFEDRKVDITINSQLISANTTRVDSISEADIILAINIKDNMKYLEDISQNDVDLNNFINKISNNVDSKVVGICDVASPTGTDFVLFNKLYDLDLLFKIKAYASWNTSSNTIGTVLAASICHFIFKDDNKTRRFNIARYYDDVGYCSYCRTKLDLYALSIGYKEELLDGQDGICTKKASELVFNYMLDTYPNIAKYVNGLKMTSIWNRSFEMDFIIDFKN